MGQHHTASSKRLKCEVCPTCYGQREVRLRDGRVLQCGSCMASGYILFATFQFARVTGCTLLHKPLDNPTADC